MAERKFRDGKREIPDYLHELMHGLETHKLTYEEALDAMNRKQLSDYAGKAVERVVMDHFAEHRR